MPDRLTTDAIVAELAATIDAYNQTQERRDKAQEKVEYERKEGLAELLSRLPPTRPEHHAFCASWALERAMEIADRSLSRVEANEMAKIEATIERALQAVLAVAPPPKGTPWRTVVEFFVGCLPEPDPLVDLERRYGGLLDTDDAAANEMADTIVETDITGIEGVAVMARLLINSSEVGKSIWDQAAASAILEWVGRQTGRNEFVGALNFENVGVEADGAEAQS